MKGVGDTGGGGPPRPPQPPTHPRRRHLLRGPRAPGRPPRPPAGQCEHRPGRFSPAGVRSSSLSGGDPAHPVSSLTRCRDLGSGPPTCGLRLCCQVDAAPAFARGGDAASPGGAPAPGRPLLPTPPGAGARTRIFKWRCLPASVDRGNPLCVR